jgi:hypothetical protein
MKRISIKRQPFINKYHHSHDGAEILQGKRPQVSFYFSKEDTQFSHKTSMAFSFSATEGSK